MNWNNIDLTNQYEREQDILDAYSTDTLLLEVACNVKDINRETVKAQFLEVLNAKIASALEILDNNLDNIVNQAIKERNS